MGWIGGCFLRHSRLRKNYCGTVEIQWPVHLGQQENTAQDAQKVRPARLQRAKRRRRTLRYVELLSEARTPLAEFFSILIGAAFLRRLSRRRGKYEGPRLIFARVYARDRSGIEVAVSCHHEQAGSFGRQQCCGMADSRLPLFPPGREGYGREHWQMVAAWRGDRCRYGCGSCLTCLPGEVGMADGNRMFCRPHPVWTEQEPSGHAKAVSPEPVECSLTGCGKNHFGTAELRGSARVAQQENTPPGCSKRPSSKAVASEGPSRTLWGTWRV